MYTIHIVTACDHKAYQSMLIPFIGSLRTLGKWEGLIHVVDLGLWEEEKEVLKNNDIHIIPSIHRLKSGVCDRFSSISDYFKDQPNDEVYVYDADIWFCDDIHPLFQELNNPYTLLCTHDATWQGFLMGCVRLNKSYIEKMYNRITSELGYVLQVGFVGGKVSAYQSFSRLQEHLIDFGIAGDVYGTDTLVLNMYYDLHPSELKVIETKYNSLPDWGIYQQDGKFYNAMTDKQITCIHVTSPHRSHGRFDFKTHRPDEYKIWKDVLEVSDLATKEKSNV